MRETFVAYVSLYRKYRPQSFADVVGQDHVTRTLVHAIEEDRLHHAYLFTGPRGTGKTSTARILAKAINCEQGPTATPCETCASCTAITAGSAVDVIELDMASHGGVDDARELRDRALFAPATSRRKVYILDEVHMASTAAFNALLKLVEEPPGHVLFAMATTDPQKVLPTILSRVQRLDLRRVAASELGAHVRQVCAAEGYTIDVGAVDEVVRAGDGSVRDTLSVLEQVLAYAGTEVTADAVAQVLGRTPAERVVETVERLVARDLAGLFGIVQGLLDEGHDLRRFTLDLVQHLRDLLVLQVAPDRPDLVDATDERRRRLQAQAPSVPAETLLRAVDLLAETVAEQRQGSPRLPLELALARLATPGADGDVAELADRIARLEAGTSPRAAGTVTGQGHAPPAPAETSAAAERVDHPAEPAPELGASPPQDLPAADAAATDAARAEAAPVADAPEPDDAPADAQHGAADADVGAAPVADLDGFLTHWPSVLELVRGSSRRCHAMFEPATPVTLANGILTLRYTKRYATFHASNARKAEFADVLRDAIAGATGLRLRVEVVVEGDDERRRPQPPSVTPDDARTPVLDDPPPPTGGTRARERGAPAAATPPGPIDDDADPGSSSGTDGDAEEVAVREAELEGTRTPDADAVDDLLAAELDATLLEEVPPAGADD